MIHHEDSDEDDYEGYFLRPVNEYKLTDRIISANKELFESQSISSNKTTENIGRRVTFRDDLEDYEPDLYINDEDDRNLDDDDFEESDTIDDDILDEIVPNVDFDAKFLDKTTDLKKSPNLCDKMSAEEQAPSDIQEICEEIEEVIYLKNSNDDQSDTKKTQSIEPKSDLSEESVIELINTNGVPILDSHHCSTVLESSNLNNKQTRIASDQRPTSSGSSSSILPSSISTKSKSKSKSKSSPRRLRKLSDQKMLKMQLNLKPCCEYKLQENNRLPRYSGYFSQYGLSREQLDERETKRQQKHRRRSEQAAMRSEEQLTKSQANEDAFARWLKNKMRNPRNLTKNMYDYKPIRQSRRHKPK